MPSHIVSDSRLFGRTVEKTTFQSGVESEDCSELSMQLRGPNDLENIPDQRSRGSVFGRPMGLQNRLNQDLRTTDHISMSTASRAFGLQSRNSSSVSSLHQEDDLRMNRIISGMHQRNNISTVSKTFGLISDDLNGITSQNNGRLNQEMRRNISGFSSVASRPFGLHTRTLTSQLESFPQDSSRVNQDTNLMNYRSTRTCMGAGNLGGLISHDSDDFNQDFKRNYSVNSSVMMRQFGLQSRTLTSTQDVGLRLNNDSTLRSNNISTISKTYGPGVQNTYGFNTQENTRYNDDTIDNGGFRRPMLTRDIRGRNSILTSRLFQNQNTKRHCKDLSNANVFNVSHISMRDVDSQSDSRVPINGRNNWKSNQSMSGSVLSVTSVKSQFLNLLENLHHSILSIGPHDTAEAVRMEFDRAKQRLENICEMSYAPSVIENYEPSIISQSSKYTCPPVTEPTTSTSSYGNPLKSSKELLKTLISSKDNFRLKFKLSTHMEEEEGRKSLQNKKSNDDEAVFKKPGPYIRKNKKRKSLRLLKVKTPEVKSPKSSPASNKVIKLKQWYPIAIGSDLAFCGFDENGETVKTDAVKKRLSNRKVELINGLCCNLIGSPSTMVSVLPKKIITLLKNGLTDRWRVLQKELLNCQTAEEETKKRTSKSPRLGNSPDKKKMKTPVGKKTKNKCKTPKVTSTPKKKIKVPDFHTRSGRTVKPPSMFWIATGSREASSRRERSDLESTLVEESSNKKTNTPLNTPVKKSKKTSRESPMKANKNILEASPKKKPVTRYASPRKPNKKNEGSLARKVKASPVKSKMANESFKYSKKEPPKGKSPKKKKKKETEEIEKVNSSTKDAKRDSKSRNVQGKRKRDVYGDAEAVQAKKSKIEKRAVIEVESTKETSSLISTSGKKKKSGLTLFIPSKAKGKKSPTKKKKETVKKKKKSMSESKMEAKEVSGFQEDFELKLDDIEIPEIANVSGNPQLSRSQLRLISMETPPLKYFNRNLDLLRSATPERSPSWYISQRTESEVKQFQKRREEAFKKKIKVDIKKTVVTEKRKNVQNKDVKKVMEWVAEKTVRSPQWSSEVLKYVIPSRKQLEERMNNEEDEDEDVETEFL